MIKVKATSMIIGKTEDYILLKPDVEESYDDAAVRGYRFHFSNVEACAEAFKMCDVLAKISEDNVNGWEMYFGRVGGNDALIFTDEYSSECYAFTFCNERDLHTACEMANRYRELAHGGDDENERQDAYDAARHVYDAAIANGCSEQDARDKASRVLDDAQLKQ